MFLFRRLKSFGYAIKGLHELLRSQENARVHAAAAVGAILAGWYLGLSAVEWALVGMSIAFVFSAEAFNTAVEYLTDLVSPEVHPLAGKIKDLAAAAVLCAALGALCCGACVFLPKLWYLFVQR